MTNKIPIKNLLLHISNVINACDITSVTSCRIKEYLKHKFKNSLPCENDLDIIVENVIKSIKLSQALNADFVPVEESNYESLDSYDDLVGNEMRDLNSPDEPTKICERGKIYVLKRGRGDECSTCTAYSYSVKHPSTSKTIRIIKPFSPNAEEISEASTAVEETATNISEENTKPCVASDAEPKYRKKNTPKTQTRKKKPWVPSDANTPKTQTRKKKPCVASDAEPKYRKKNTQKTVTKEKISFGCQFTRTGMKKMSNSLKEQFKNLSDIQITDVMQDSKNYNEMIEVCTAMNSSIPLEFINSPLP